MISSIEVANTAAKAAYRNLLRAVRKHVGREDHKSHYTDFIKSEFIGNATSQNPQKLKLAEDYAFYLNSVHHQKKVGFTGGSYMNGHFGQVYPGQAMVGAGALMPMYPFYHFNQSQSMGLPAHLYCPTAVGPMPTVPALISKPTSIAPPNAVCLAVE